MYKKACCQNVFKCDNHVVFKIHLYKNTISFNNKNKSVAIYAKG